MIFGSLCLRAWRVSEIKATVCRSVWGRKKEKKKTRVWISLPSWASKTSRSMKLSVSHLWNNASVWEELSDLAGFSVYKAELVMWVRRSLQCFGQIRWEPHVSCFILGIKPAFWKGMLATSANKWTKEAARLASSPHGYRDAFGCVQVSVTGTTRA